MKRYGIDVTYSITVPVYVDAEDEDDAIEQAKSEAWSMLSLSDAEFDDAYVTSENDI